jgi:hypothetical protein
VSGPEGLVGLCCSGMIGYHSGEAVTQESGRVTASPLKTKHIFVQQSPTRPRGTQRK